MPHRQAPLARLRDEAFDVLLVGGGINGAGIARDLSLRATAAGEPLRVALIEKNHFASGTSGRNSQLIHGGLRYLKYFEFRLVHEALRERSILLAIAPHLVKPLPLLIPMYSHFSRVFYGTGLWLYDMLAGERNIGKHRQVSVEDVALLEPGLNREDLVSGAIFYDCRVHAARFCLENVLEAEANGVCAANYVEAVSFNRVKEGWQVDCRDRLSGTVFTVRAQKLVDTTGPWSGDVWGDGEQLRLVRGSHLIIPRVNQSGKAIAYFDDDGRIVFLIPWGSAGQFTLVGTTDADHEGSPDDVRISRAETEYLLGIVRRLYPAASGVQPVAAYSALRPLVRDDADSPTSTSREHRIWNSDDGVLHVSGGKYTTYRAMSEEAADMVCAELAPGLQGMHPTASAPLYPQGRVHSPLMAGQGDLMEQLEHAVAHERAVRLSDALFVSTYRGYEQVWDEASLGPPAARMGRLLDWDERRRGEEVARTVRMIDRPEAV